MSEVRGKNEGVVCVSVVVVVGVYRESDGNKQETVGGKRYLARVY